MVTNFNPSNPNIKEIIHKTWNMLSHSLDCGELFKEKLLVRFRILPNLRDMLTKASITYPLPDTPTTTPKPPICTRLGKCTYCPLIKKINTVKCNFTKKSYQLNDLPKHITCELSNVIYLIKKNATNTMLVQPAGHLESKSKSTALQAQYLPRRGTQ